MAAPPLPLDRYSGALMTLSHDEHEAFMGHAFKALYESVAPVPTAVGEMTAIGWLTPPLPTRIHLTFDAWADDESVLEFRENPAIVLDEGAELPPINRFRHLGVNTSQMSGNITVPAVLQYTTYTALEAAAAGLAGGTILHHETLAVGGAAPFASKMNTMRRGERKWILLPSTEYCVVLTNATINDTVHGIALHWHEEIDANYKH